MAVSAHRHCTQQVARREPQTTDRAQRAAQHLLHVARNILRAATGDALKAADYGLHVKNK